MFGLNTAVNGEEGARSHAASPQTEFPALNGFDMPPYHLRPNDQENNPCLRAAPPQAAAAQDIKTIDTGTTFSKAIIPDTGLQARFFARLAPDQIT